MTIITVIAGIGVFCILAGLILGMFTEHCNMALIFAIIGVMTFIGSIAATNIGDSKIKEHRTEEVTEIRIQDQRSENIYIVYTENRKYRCYMSQIKIGEKNEISYDITSLNNEKNIKVTVTPDVGEKINIVQIQKE